MDELIAELEVLLEEYLDLEQMANDSASSWRHTDSHLSHSYGVAANAYSWAAVLLRRVLDGQEKQASEG